MFTFNISSCNCSSILPSRTQTQSNSHLSNIHLISLPFQICEILVRTILYRLRQSCSQADIFINLLSIFFKFCECRNGNDRPVCTYLVTLHDWLPTVALQNGKSLQRMTLLSPIFYMSSFAEDDIEYLVTQLDKITDQDSEVNFIRMNPFDRKSLRLE